MWWKGGHGEPGAHACVSARRVCDQAPPPPPHPTHHHACSLTLGVLNLLTRSLLSGSAARTQPSCSPVWLRRFMARALYRPGTSSLLVINIICKGGGGGAEGRMGWRE